MASSFERNLNDPRSRKVLGFLIAKGLLLHNSFIRTPRSKFTIDDALWVAEHVEPRVLEVLPAVMIHFPATISRIGTVPENLNTVVKAIKSGHSHGPNLGSALYKDMFRWANHVLPDRRTKPVSQHRKLKTFKFGTEAIVKLKRLSAKYELTETELLERYILGAK